MRTGFPLFQSHLDLAHVYWSTLLKPGDWAIDATCGNGHDTLKLAECILEGGEGRLWAIDIQEEAIVSTRKLLESRYSQDQLKHIYYLLGNHQSYPETIEPGSIALIVYNLGYLPGGDKGITTLSSSTIDSLKKALILLKPGGAVSITCYPGHPEGKREEEEIAAWCRKLDPKQWSCCHHRWMNRREAPSLLLVQKSFSTQPQSDSTKSSD